MKGRTVTVGGRRFEIDPSIDEDFARDLEKELALAGSGDPIEIQAALVPKLRRFVAALSGEKLRRAEAPGKWSILHVIMHLADAEMVYGVRIRMIAAQEAPLLTGFDQTQWATRFDYASAEPEAALAQLELLRSANLGIYRGLTAEDFERYGIHSQYGRITLRMMLHQTAGHDLAHRAQIERIRRVVV